MSNRNYEDLSRRAMIKLGHDYDRDNGDQLKTYFVEKDTQVPYEGIRPVEKMTEQVDHLTETIKENGGALKRAAVKSVNNMLERVIDAVDGVITGVNREENN